MLCYYQAAFNLIFLIYLAVFRKAFNKCACACLRGKANLTVSNKSNKKKILFSVFSILLLLLGTISMVAGVFFMYKSTTTDSEGYSLSNPYTVETSANAFVLWDSSPTDEDDLKWVITSLDSNKEIFAGWGASSTVNAYIYKYQYATPGDGWSYSLHSYDVTIDISDIQIENPEKPVVPLTQEMWLGTITTNSTASLPCSPNNEDDSFCMLVIMNADGSDDVNAQIQLGSKMQSNSWLPYVFILVGLMFLVAGLLLVKRVRK
jgi:hypothetical protein